MGKIRSNQRFNAENSLPLFLTRRLLVILH